jgi:hypothetical protein
MAQASNPMQLSINRAAAAAGLSISAAIATSIAPAAHAQAGAADRILHISVDGLRSDQLEAQVLAGNAPNFARLISEGASTLNARTDQDFTYTLPNHTTQWTGRPVNDQPSFGGGQGQGHNYYYNFDDEDNPFSGSNIPGGDIATVHNANAVDLSVFPGQAPDFGVAQYVHSVFNTVSDNDGQTAMFAGKSKFDLFDRSWGPSVADPNNSVVLDQYVFNSDINLGQLINGGTQAGDPTPGLLSQFTPGNNLQYTALHLRTPDSVGHAEGWGSPEYQQAIQTVDAALGQILNDIDADRAGAGDRWGDVTVILTADHGGGDDPTGGDITMNHALPTVEFNYTIPFVVWGAGVTPGTDLYELNAAVRDDPGDLQITYASSSAGLGEVLDFSDLDEQTLSLLGFTVDPILNQITAIDEDGTVLTFDLPDGFLTDDERLFQQPIRNGDAPNLGLYLLGYDAVTNSSINADQSLRVPEPATAAVLAGGLLLLGRRRRWLR